MSDVLEALFEEVEEAVDKVVRCGRAAGFISLFEIVLLASSALAVVAYLMLHGWYFAAVGGAFAAASLGVDRLRYRYYRKTLYEADKLKRLVRMAALAIRLDHLTAEIEKEIEEMERMLKKTAQN